MQKLILCSLIFIMSFIQARAAEDAEPVAKNSAYVSLGEPMVLNLSGAKRLTFLQISADVLVGDDSAEETIKIHVPAIRHSLIMLLSEQKAGDIKSPGKREEIRQQATRQVQALIADLSGSQDVSDILFSSILVQ
jgi:flagellar FliL protein